MVSEGGSNSEPAWENPQLGAVALDRASGLSMKYGTAVPTRDQAEHDLNKATGLLMEHVDRSK